MEEMRELINQAYQMLVDRNKEEARLIYVIAKLPEDLRAAIILAYALLEKENE